MATRKYKAGVRAALISFSAGICYWPACGKPLLANVNGEYFIDLDIAHICALKKSGPRYDPDMTDAQRNDFPNVIFLCRSHHKAVDANNGKDYPVETLRMWKNQRETSAQASMSSQSPVTAELLEKCINQAIAERNERIENTLDRLEKNDVEAALVIRELLDELKVIRRNRSSIDPDSVAMLSNAARKLATLQDSAALLNEAATKLQGAHDAAKALDAAADKIFKAQGFM